MFFSFSCTLSNNIIHDLLIWNGNELRTWNLTNWCWSTFRLLYPKEHRLGGFERKSLYFLRQGIQNEDDKMVGLWWGLFHGCRTLPSYCVLVWQKESKELFFWGGVSVIMYLIPLTCFTIMTYPSLETLHWIHLGVSLSTWEFRVAQTCSP